MSSSSCCASSPSIAVPSCRTSSIADSRSASEAPDATSAISKRVELGVPRLVDPVILEQVAEQRVELLVVADVFDVVELNEPLDSAREQQRA